MEDILFDLIKWAHDATEQSYNKPVLPYAVIVFVNKDRQEDQRDYDVNFARDSVFDNVNLDDDLKWYVQYWEEGGKPTIDSGEDLLKRYYKLVNVVHFPSEEEPTKMHEQVKKLYNEISSAHQATQQSRDKVWMKMTATTLPLYYRKAFTHFASNYTVPFDFSDAWIDLHHISFNLQGGVFNLATKVGVLKNQQGMDVWNEIAGFVASCLLLGCARKGHTSMYP